MIHSIFYVNRNNLSSCTLPEVLEGKFTDIFFVIVICYMYCIIKIPSTWLTLHFFGKRDLVCGKWTLINYQLIE